MLKTKRLELRELAEDDRSDILKNINDSSVYRWTLKVPYPYENKDFDEFLEMNRKWQKEGTTINFIIHLKGTDEAIGGVGIMNIEKDNGSAEIGYWISKDHRGEGLVPEALKAVSKMAFDELGLFRLEAVIFSENAPSRRVLEKSGFTFEGISRGRYLKDGKRIDGARYSLLRTDPYISGAK